MSRVRWFQKDEIVKGLRIQQGRTSSARRELKELEELRVPSKHAIEVTQFIDVAELNPEYIEKPYFVTPENNNQAEAFAVVRQALQKTGKAAIGKVSFSGRENIVAVLPADNRGMMAYTLRYQNELKNHNDFFRDIKATEINDDMLELAESLIAKRSSKFDLSKFEDGYELAVKELVNAKLKHLPIPKDEVPASRAGKVVNLMDALRKSIGARFSSIR